MGKTCYIIRRVVRRQLRLAVLGIAACAGVMLGGCASTPPAAHRPNSYCITGHGCYRVLPTARGYERDGIASWYGAHAAGKPTASGEPYDPHRMTAASKVLPFGTWVRITDLDNGRQIVAMVNDRGPFHEGRIIDLSVAAARRLGIIGPGTAHVRVAAIPVAQLSEAQREAARHNAELAVRYTITHPVIHVLSGGTDLVLRGGYYVVRDGVRGGYDVVRGGVDVGLDVAGGVVSAILP